MDDGSRLIHPSSSHEHQSAEALILDAIAEELELPDLTPARLELGDATVDLDGWSPSGQVAVEIYARVTRPKGAAYKKPMDDAMRLLLVRHRHPDARLLLGFCSPLVADAFRGSGWRAASLDAVGIEVVQVDLDDETVAGLEAATVRQYR